MTGQDDFIARALSSLSQQMALANAAGGGVADDKNSILNETIEAHAKSLVDDDTPKIDSAVKSYLSLVAARSVVASEIDVLSENVKSFDAQVKLNSMDMKSALVCARKLLNGINTTVVPRRNGKEEEKDESDDGGSKNEINDETQQMMNAATHIVWNRLVENKDMKPSKVLGRKSLKVAWPYIEERFRRGADSADDSSINNVDALIRSYSIEILPAIAPPQGIEMDSWIAYYTEFGNLLTKACQNDKSKQEDDGENEDDSKLLWAHDKGVSELQRRQDRRAKRAESLTQSKNDAEKESVAEE
eukprot:CAMPEP_0201722894 /NCGR_PEP_ID=MMETSP0593-20130828/7102_1 /ASSEMBLY_ACC=CAM_ASM_000672 /TAXON_ID=267983 /ORGANISM="Skeletonema japonicum, Strain CCMP2506" /LENGTH=301 /DNA_ID=CAMNT_0048213901 /DNA_START=111 /DNA_END=1016 /DNA_ORIENTATION=+